VLRLARGPEMRGPRGHGVSVDARGNGGREPDQATARRCGRSGHQCESRQPAIGGVPALDQLRFGLPTQRGGHDVMDLR
jgi:hypothetical protein